MTLYSVGAALTKAWSPCLLFVCGTSLFVVHDLSPSWQGDHSRKLGVKPFWHFMVNRRKLRMMCFPTGSQWSSLIMDDMCSYLYLIVLRYYPDIGEWIRWPGWHCLKFQADVYVDRPSFQSPISGWVGNNWFIILLWCDNFSASNMPILIPIFLNNTYCFYLLYYRNDYHDCWSGIDW